MYVCESVSRINLAKFIDVKVRKLWKFKLVKERRGAVNQ